MADELPVHYRGGVGKPENREKRRLWNLRILRFIRLGGLPNWNCTLVLNGVFYRYCLSYRILALYLNPKVYCCRHMLVERSRWRMTRMMRWHAEEGRLQLRLDDSKNAAPELHVSLLHLHLRNECFSRPPGIAAETRHLRAARYQVRLCLRSRHLYPRCGRRIRALSSRPLPRQARPPRSRSGFTLWKTANSSRAEGATMNWRL